jgi:NitT/TauT family transport system ATP-binding protein
VRYTRNRHHGHGARGHGRGRPGTGGVHVEAVAKSLGEGDKRRLILNDVSLSIGRGEFVSIIGPSGCGKSTLLKLVAGLSQPDAGRVLIDGAEVEEATRAKAVGLVPQDPALLPWRSVRRNVELAVKVNPRGNEGRSLMDPVEILGALGLGEVLDRYPSQLSGGMQQRVAIARAYAFNPDVLLMDEPFSALDEINRDRQRMGLLHFWQSHRKAVLFVTHSVAEAVILSDRIVVMAAGPGRVHQIVDVNLPRPRSRKMFEDPEFRKVEHDVQVLLHSVSGDVGHRAWEPAGGELNV